MAAMVRAMVGRRLASPSSCLLQSVRQSHRQTMWERILGKKVAPSTVKALEDAYTELSVSKSVPSWLPFLPNSSFWIPSFEATLENLEELVEAFEQEPPASRRRKHLLPSFTASSDLLDEGVSSADALSAIQVTDQLVEKLPEIPLENGTKILLVNVNDVNNERNEMDEIDDNEEDNDDEDDVYEEDDLDD